MNAKELAKQLLGKDAKIVSPLHGGMMNESYIVETPKKKYVMFIPTQQANEMVNRYVERETQDIASHLHLTSKNVYFDIDTGIKIHEYIEGESLNNVEDVNLNRVAGLLKYFHNSPRLSTVDYRPFPRLLGYEKQARKYSKRTPSDYGLLRSVLSDNKKYLESQEKVLCHNDSQRSNIVREKDTDKYFLIDFEFAANNDPIYDIAAYGNNSVSEGRELLNAYYGKPSKDEIKRYYLWRIFLSLQWYNVAIVKHYRGEGEKHNFNFLDVAKYFLSNAKEAYEGLKKEVK